MQRWEYMARTRHRDPGMLKSRSWKDDVVNDLARLGNDGWELITVSPASGDLGAAGVTTQETWIFKRPKA